MMLAAEVVFSQGCRVGQENAAPRMQLGLMRLIVSKDALFFSMVAVMAFELSFGTVLTLGVVPVLYSLLFRIRQAD